MARHPDVQERAVRELEEVFGDDTRTPSLSDLRRLKYLEQCIKETLRLYPSVPILSRTLTEDAKIGTSAESCSSGQEIFIILWNPRVRYLCSQIDPIIGQINSVLTYLPYFFNNHFNIILLSKPMSSQQLFSCDFVTETLYVFIISLMYITCPVPFHNPWSDHPENIW
jgi:hypothetical protein